MEAAENERRELTDEEKAITEPVLKEARDIADNMAKTRDEDAMKDAINREFDGVLGGLGGSSTGAKSGQRLSFASMGATAATVMLPDGLKALAPSGSAVVDQEFKPDPIPLGQVALSLLDVVPVTQHSTPEFAYLRQTVRTNLAAVVAEGAVKPTSTYTLTRIEASLVVVAHLSEGISRYWLLDQASLETFVSNELEYGLRLAVEAKLLADVNGTSGIQSQAYATSVLATLRKSITKLETAGYTPSSLILHPGDWEGVELALSSTNSIEHQGLPYDPASRRLFGVPVVVSNAQAAGVSHALASDAVSLDTDTRGIDVQWSETSNDTDFSKNLIRARCEGRFATSVYSPLGVVVGDLTA